MARPPFDYLTEDAGAAMCSAEKARSRVVHNLFGWCPECSADVFAGEPHDRHCKVGDPDAPEKLPGEF